MKQLAQAMRRQATDAERMLWQHLRSRNLAGFKFRRQVVIEPYIVDFVCFEAKLIIEADGWWATYSNSSQRCESHS